jgi:streptomycin 6-kinase
MATIFDTNIIKVWGDTGRLWLDKLPTIISILSKYWNLTNLNPVDNLSYNYVLTGYQDILPVVLKISCNQAEIQKEIVTLQTYNGNNSIKLLDSYLEYNACLLEKATPGGSLKSFFPDNDDEALVYAANIMKALHSVTIPTHLNLPTLKSWLKDLHNPHSNLSYYHINKAQNLAHNLFETQTKSVLLHGDLHHDNILLSKRGWLAIDPKGIIGDPAFEVYGFIKI